MRFGPIPTKNKLFPIHTIEWDCRVHIGLDPVIAFTSTFQKNKFLRYYVLIVSHETPNTHTIDMTPMVSLSFYSIFVEYTICCQFNTILTAPSISPDIFQLLKKTCIVWLIIGIYLLPNFSFLIFSSIPLLNLTTTGATFVNN